MTHYTSKILTDRNYNFNQKEVIIQINIDGLIYRRMYWTEQDLKDIIPYYDSALLERQVLVSALNKLMIYKTLIGLYERI